MSARYYIDERIGCIAIRDRHRTDPEYNGLHADTEGVVWFRQGRAFDDVCPECGHKRGVVWSVSTFDKAEALLECARLNSIDDAALLADGI